MDIPAAGGGGVHLRFQEVKRYPMEGQAVPVQLSVLSAHIDHISDQMLLLDREVALPQ